MKSAIETLKLHAADLGLKLEAVTDTDAMWDGRAIFDSKPSTNPPIYALIREVLTHAVKGEGRTLGPVEVYPLQGGGVFTVVWVGDDGALLTIGEQKNAF